ncbi:type II secretion system protein [Alicyclobacillus acidiphilus]|uniref:type II secretion system protein n=1 Tax=Alicyclobacillus acidiphilus TaxID=182455 RepID=UPI001FE04076|nr:type II secretion system protein [Alicyclobacillus acidiphilus]
MFTLCFLPAEFADFFYHSEGLSSMQRLIRDFRRARADYPQSDESGFTLIEVLASMVILVILGSAVFFALQRAQTDTLDNAEYNQALGLATTIAEELRDNYPFVVKYMEVPIPADSLGANSSSSASSAINIVVSSSTPPVATSFGHFTCYVTIPNKDAYGNPNYSIKVVDPNGRAAVVTVDDPAILGAGG